MILISKSERAALEKAGLLKHKLQWSRKHPAQDANFKVVNVQHKGRSKHTYVVETMDVLAFLGKWDLLPNLQPINSQQVRMLKEAGLITEGLIQYSGTYNPDALMYVASNGQVRIKKVTELMKAAGIWQ